MPDFLVMLRGLAMAVLLAAATAVHAQRVALPTPLPPTTAAYQAPGGPTATLGTQIQPFDPYSTGPMGSAIPPAAQPPTLPPAGYTAPGYTAPGYTAPSPYAPPAGFSGGPPAVYPETPYYGPPPAPPMGWPGQPPAGQPPWPLPPQVPYQRFIEDVRAKYTWLAGASKPNDLAINELELAVTFAVPNFLYSPQPIRITPVFIFDWLAGPAPDFPIGVPVIDGDPPVGALVLAEYPDLPSKVYSAFVDFAWDPQLTPQLGAELNVNVGVYSDFQSFNTDSVRIRGTGLGVVALTPTIKAKLGVTYLDRLNKKLLPAVGVLWEPTPQTRLDIFFPEPKLAQYLTSIGNTAVWGYVGGEYGGGNWTLERKAFVLAEEELDPGPPPITDTNLYRGTTGDRVDINDIRLFAGLEWQHTNRLTGFFEVGYVFDREIVYDRNPAINTKLRDTVMLRGGVIY